MPYPLNHSPADVVGQLLVDLGLGTSADVDTDADLGQWPVGVGNELEYPDETLTVYDTAGRTDARFMPDGHLAEHHGIQLRVRGRDQQTAHLKARGVRRSLLTDVYDRTVYLADDVGTAATAYVVHAVVGAGNVLSLGKNVPNDARSLFTVNFLVVIRPAN